MSWRRMVVTGCIAAIVVVGFWRASQPVQPTPLRVGGERTHVIDHRRVANLDVQLNGQPLLGTTHVARLGADVKITGILGLKPEEIPSGAMQARLMVVHYPQGTSEDFWSKRNSKRQWSKMLLGNERKVQMTETVSQELFKPGEYELRAYLYIKDFEGDEHAFDYLGNATLLVSE